MNKELREVLDTLAPDGYVSIAKAAELTGVVRNTLYGYTLRGKLKSVKIAGCVFVEEAALEGFHANARDIVTASAPEGYVKILEASKRTGLTVEQIYYYNTRKYINAVKVNGHWYINENDIEELKNLTIEVEGYISVLEASITLGLSAPTVYRLIRSGMLESITAGKRQVVRVNKKSVDTLLEKYGRFDNLVRLKDLATASGHSYQSLYRMIKSGELPALKLSRSFYVTKETAENVLAGKNFLPEMIKTAVEAEVVKIVTETYENIDELADKIGVPSKKLIVALNSGFAIAPFALVMKLCQELCIDPIALAEGKVKEVE